MFESAAMGLFTLVQAFELVGDVVPVDELMQRPGGRTYDQGHCPIKKALSVGISITCGK